MKNLKKGEIKMEEQKFEFSTNVFKKEHLDLKQDFLSRVGFLMNEKCEVKSYAVSDEYGSEVEQIRIKVNGFSIDIKLSK